MIVCFELFVVGGGIVFVGVVVSNVVVELVGTVDVNKVDKDDMIVVIFDVGPEVASSVAIVVSSLVVVGSNEVVGLTVVVSFPVVASPLVLVGFTVVVVLIVVTSLTVVVFSLVVVGSTVVVGSGI